MTTTHTLTDSRLPKHLPPGRILSTTRSLTQATRAVDASGLADIVHAHDRTRPGKPRKVSLEALLVTCLAYKRRHLKSDFLLTDISRWAATFNKAQRRKAGLPDDWNYDNLQTAFKALCDLLEPEDSPGRVDVRTGEIRPRSATLPTLQLAANKLIAGAIPAGIALPQVLAIDSTDCPTHGARRSMLTLADVAAGHMPVDNPKKAKPWNTPGWPKVGPDGRAVTTVDPDARLGYRSELNGSGIFCGYDAHTLVDAGNRGGDVIPQLFRGIWLSPAGSYKADSGISLLDNVPYDLAGCILTSDRGYSYAVAGNWVYRLQDRNIKYLHDLHPNQRRQAVAELAGAIWIDGTLFPDSLPKQYRKLGTFSRGMSLEDRLALIRLYDERAQWAFTVNRTFENGSVQLKGPARTGHVRCRNYAPSMRGKHSAPLTSCTPGTECACAATKVILRAEAARERQLFPFGTTDWAALYGLRNAVESGNAQLKTWRGSLRRHNTYVMGLTANTIAFAIHCAAINMAIIDDAYDGQVTLATRSAKHVPASRRRRPIASPAMHRRPATRPLAGR